MNDIYLQVMDRKWKAEQEQKKTMEMERAAKVNHPGTGNLFGDLPYDNQSQGQGYPNR